MNRWNHILAALLFAVPVLASARPAQAAGGVWLQRHDLPAAARAALYSAVSAEKARNPSAFEAVAQIKGCTLAGYSQTRLGKPLCGRELRVGKGEWLLPLLSALALQEPRAANGHVPYATAEERQAFAAGAIEAVGLLRDERAREVLHAAFTVAPAGQMADNAAEALGRLGGDRELATLVQSAKTPVRLQSALRGLGECKRIEAAKAIALGLAAAKSPNEVTLWANAAGRVASSWAWQAMVRAAPARATEASDVRTVAARALAEAMATTVDAVAVEELVQALQMTEHPQAVAMLAEVRGKTAPAHHARFAMASQRVADYLKRN
ncbi:MAG: hypothetical protein FJ100_17495 [Deltaproteobacteria bacterium]|nr:hypothetical protein [Deltaproteobacteria bacterium]